MSNTKINHRKGVRFFNTITDEGNERCHTLTQKNRGRNIDLVLNRNICLLQRYYYYAKIKKLKYEDTVALLCKEFFIAEITIINIIQRTANLPGCSPKEMKSLKELQSTYEFLNWKN